ncbi:MAG: DUF805 domain-containing protein [Verrucomicrobiota bacterium]
MNQSFLSSEGRISRPIYIVRIVLLALLTAAISKVAIDYFNEWHKGHYAPLGIFVTIVTSIICGFIGMMQLIKRLHDMGKGPFLAVLLIVPGANVLLLLYAAIAPAAKD